MNNPTDSRPSFDELQAWALANWIGGDSDQEAFDAWMAAHPERAEKIRAETILRGPTT